MVSLRKGFFILRLLIRLCTKEFPVQLYMFVRKRKLKVIRALLAEMGLAIFQGPPRALHFSSPCRLALI